MANEVRNYQEAQGLDDVQMAALLSERLDRTISPAGFRIVKGRRDVPVEWLESLGIAPSEPAPRPVDDLPEPGSKSTDTKPGVTDVLPFEPASAQMQITMVYTMAGRGAAMALHSPQVAEVWAQHAPQIAAGYIEWAKENATVARYIGMLTLGGPAGKLLLLHGSMLVTTLIVSGQVNPEQFVPPSMRAPQETDTIREPREGVDDDDANGTGDGAAYTFGASPIRGVE